MSKLSLQVDSLGKRYRLGPAPSLARKLRDAWRSRRRMRPFDGRADGAICTSEPAAEREFWALRDVNFEIRPGEVVGFIGRNGAGKSTLLKILSRITAPTTGRAVIRGRVAALLEVGTGFHPDLSGRENVFVSGVTLGLQHAEIRRRFDEIVAFAELERFIDTPVKHYSSGMYMRLAFSVAAHLLADVMILDEVLAVGDAAFQRKCLQKVENVANNSGRTVLFVSHSMPAVQSLCTRAILLEEGCVTMDDKPARVIESYLGRTKQAIVRRRFIYPTDERLRLQIDEVRLEDLGDDVVFHCTYSTRKRLPDVMLCIEVRSAAGISVYYANDDSIESGEKREIGTHRVSCVIPASMLAPGEYTVHFGFWQPGHNPEHFPEDSLTFTRKDLEGRLASHCISWPSVICLPTAWNYDRARGAHAS